MYIMTRKNGRKGRTTRKQRKMVGGDDESLIDDNYDLNLGVLFGGIVILSLALAIGRV
jgi:hypothetical protein